MGGRTMDTPALLHPLDVQAAAEWGYVRSVFARIFVTANTTNRVVNPPYWVERPLFSYPPSWWPLGPSRHEVISSEGWPVYGYLITERSGSGERATQVLKGDDGSRRERDMIFSGGAYIWGDWL